MNNVVSISQATQLVVDNINIDMVLNRDSSDFFYVITESEIQIGTDASAVLDSIRASENYGNYICGAVCSYPFVEVAKWL